MPSLINPLDLDIHYLCPSYLWPEGLGGGR